MTAQDVARVVWRALVFVLVLAAVLALAIVALILSLSGEVKR
jgi:hypothetical protein